MTSTSIKVPSASGIPAVDRRLERWHLKTDTAIAIVAVFIVLISDSQGLTLIPLYPLLAAQYHLTLAQESLALSLPSIIGAATVPLLTRLGDKFGMRRLALLSLIFGLLGNVLSAAAPGFGLLLVGRIFLGFGAAYPLTFAILRERSTGIKGTNRGVGFMTAAIGLAIAVSFLLGGIVVQLKGNVSTVFWVMSVLALIALAAAWVLLPDSTKRDGSPVDYLGSVLLAIGLTAVILAITEINTWGWTSPATLAFLIGGLVVLAIFAIVESRMKHPLINIGITFRRTAWPAYIIGGLCGGLAIYSNLAIISYIEVPAALGYGFGSSVLVAAYFLCPIALFVIFGGIIVAPVMNRLGTRGTMIIGGIIIAADFFWMTAAHYEVWQYFLGSAVWGLGFSYAYGGANAAYLHAAKDGQAAMFSATNTAVSVGISGFGSAIFTFILTQKFIPKTPLPAPEQFGWLWFFAGFAGVAIVLLALVYRKPSVEEQGHLTQPPAESAVQPE